MATPTNVNVGSVEPAPTTITVTYTENDDGWITAQVVEYPGAISQGPTRHEAWVNVIGALRDLTHEPTIAERVAFTVQARIGSSSPSLACVTDSLVVATATATLLELNDECSSAG